MSTLHASARATCHGATAGGAAPPPAHVYRLALADAPMPVRAARARTVEVCHRWGLGELADVAALVVSELVTNALEHAGGAPGDAAAASLALLVTDRGLVVEVADADPMPPVVRDPGPWDEGGRGLCLVAALVSSWGCRPSADGKVVWAELVLGSGSAHSAHRV